jgi:hypothetical protein
LLLTWYKQHGVGDEQLVWLNVGSSPCKRSQMQLTGLRWHTKRPQSQLPNDGHVSSAQQDPPEGDEQLVVFQPLFLQD